MTAPDILMELGWDGYFQEAFVKSGREDFVPARVIAQDKAGWTVLGRTGELKAVIAGRLRYEASGASNFPAVGDWVVLQPGAGVILDVLPRKTRFSRQIAGGRDRSSGGLTQEQVLAANIDTVFLVSGLDGGRRLNLRRLERYLMLALNSGPRPVFLLNKADLVMNIGAYIDEVQSLAPEVPVHAVSALCGTGLDELRGYLKPGTTVALLGPSGVGKSAIINTLLGEERQTVKAVRESDRRGRHTTTRCELILLPAGGCVIDTPGMRELQLWAEGDDLEEAFRDIERLSRRCRFSDCNHQNEPDCAVREAVEAGELEAERLENYRKLGRELHYQEARQEGRVRLEEKTRWKKIARFARQIEKYRKER